MKKILTLEFQRFKDNDNYRFRLKLFNRFVLAVWTYYPITGQWK